jgi:hypothetical protein
MMMSNPIKGILIDPEARCISLVDVPTEMPERDEEGEFTPGLQPVPGAFNSLIGCRVFGIVDVPLWANCSCVHDDEGCLNDPKHFFEFRGCEPIAGKVLLLGWDFPTDTWSDAPVAIDAVKEAVEFSRRKVRDFVVETAPGIVRVSVVAPKHDDLPT